MQNQTVRHIKPLGPRVLVRIRKLDDRTGAGLYLPAGAKEEHDDALYGEVVEVARAEARQSQRVDRNPHCASLNDVERLSALTELEDALARLHRHRLQGTQHVEEFIVVETAKYTERTEVHRERMRVRHGGTSAPTVRG